MTKMDFQVNFKFKTFLYRTLLLGIAKNKLNRLNLRVTKQPN